MSRPNSHEKHPGSNLHLPINTLTPREYEVFTPVITGMWNKQVASELGASEKTIKVHRARVREKMQIVPVAMLVRLAKDSGNHLDQKVTSIELKSYLHPFPESRIVSPE